MRFLILLMISLTVHAHNRPNNAVFFKQNLCVCQDKLPVSFGNCESFCADKVTNGSEVLFADFTFKPDRYFKNVHDWCFKTHVFETKKPSCVMELRDEEGVLRIVDVAATDNTIRADVTIVPHDKTQVITIKETLTSATSDSAQMIKFENNTGLPLKTVSTKDYSTWSSDNVLFYDLDGNGALDIHDSIRRKTKSYGQDIPFLSQFFEPSPINAEIGWVVKPFIEETTYFSYCLNNTHYNSSNALFRAMGSVLSGIPTEGLYVAMSMENDYDIRFIREGELKEVWFYLRNGVPKMPNDSNVSNNKIFFHFPLDKVNPYVKKPNQIVYLLKSIQDFGGATGSYPAHDRKIGCIPKL